MYKTTITAEEINQLPLKSFEGEIICIDTLSKANEVIPKIAKESILGFDTETRPSFKKGKINKVSLLQLATADTAFLFRINLIGMPEPLVKILADNKITKIGVALKDDLKSLRKIRDFEPKKFIDLQELVKKYQIENVGLKKLAAIVLNIRISKAQQLTNWENDLLTNAQKDYAATDAWAAFMIYQLLTKNGHSVQPLIR